MLIYNLWKSVRLHQTYLFKTVDKRRLSEKKIIKAIKHTRPSNITRINSSRTIRTEFHKAQNLKLPLV